MKVLLSFFLLAGVFSSLYAAEDSVYDFEWMDADKEIYVLQNRKYRKASSVSFSAMAGKNISSKFIDQNIGSFRLGYYFSEDWGLEFNYSLSFNQSENNTAAGVLEQGAVPFYRRIDEYKSISVLYSPFYGKFNTFNKIYYVDWYFSAGIASIDTSDNRNRFAVSNDSSLTQASQGGAVWGTGLLFHLSQSWSIRFEFNGIHFQTDRFREDRNSSEQFSSKQWFHNYDMSLGINFRI